MKGKLYFLTFVLLLFACLTSCAPGSGHWEVVYHRTLSSLVVRQGMAGTFFLASGQIEGRASYIFTEVQKDGGAFIRQTDISTAVYYEDVKNGNKPYVERVECVGNVVGCDNDDSRVPEVLKGQVLLSYWYEIHVPPGSTVSVIDLGIK